MSMLPNNRSTSPSTPSTTNSASQREPILPPEITEHPTWRAVWAWLLAEKPVEKKDAA